MGGSVGLQGRMAMVPDMGILRDYKAAVDKLAAKGVRQSIKLSGGKVQVQNYVKLGSRSDAYKADNNAARLDFLTKVCKAYGFKPDQDLTYGSPEFKDAVWAYAKGPNLPKSVKNALMLDDYKTLFSDKFTTGRPLTTSRIQKVWNAIDTARHEKVFSGMKPGNKLEDEPFGNTWQVCKGFVMSMLDSKETLGLTDAELAYLKMYLNTNSQEINQLLVTRNKTGVDLETLGMLEKKAGQSESGQPLTSLVRGVLEDLVRSYRTFMTGGWSLPPVDYKPTGEFGPGSKDDVELNRFWSQSSSNNTCFMLSVVNGLAQTQRGVSLLKDCFQDDKGGLKVSIGGKETILPLEKSPDRELPHSALEATLHRAYEQDLASRKMAGERFGESGNAEEFAQVLGMKMSESISIGLANRTDKVKAFAFAAKVSEALKDGKVCVMNCSGHYRTIAGAYLDPNGRPMFRLLESFDRPPSVFDEPVSYSMDGSDPITAIKILELPPKVGQADSGPTFSDITKQVQNSERLKGNINGYSNDSVTFAKYLTCFRPGLGEKVDKRSIASFLDRLGEGLKIGELTHKWAGNKIPDRTDRCIFDCFKRNPKSALFTDPKYDKLFLGSADESELDRLKADFLRDLENLEPVQEEAKKTEAPKKQVQDSKKDSPRDDWMENARKEGAEKIKRQAAGTKINGGKEIEKSGEVDVRGLDMYAQERSENGGKVGEEAGESPKVVSEWAGLCARQQGVFDREIVGRLGNQQGDWRGNLEKDYPKLGFKTLVMGWLDEDREKHRGLNEKSFRGAAFNALANAFEGVYRDGRLGKLNLGGRSAQKVGELVLRRYGKLPKNGSVNTLLQRMAGGGELKEPDIENFKKELLEALLEEQKEEQERNG